MTISYPGWRFFNASMTADSVFPCTDTVSTEEAQLLFPICLFLSFTLTVTILHTPLLLSEEHSPRRVVLCGFAHQKDTFHNSRKDPTQTSATTKQGICPTISAPSAVVFENCEFSRETDRFFKFSMLFQILNNKLLSFSYGCGRSVARRLRFG